MPTAWKKNTTLVPGDTVYHVLYGREWLGIVLEVEKITGNFLKNRIRALVYMVPGAEYEFYFDKAFSRKVGVRRGWVTTNWLVKYEPDEK